MGLKPLSGATTARLPGTAPYVPLAAPPTLARAGRVDRLSAPIPLKSAEGLALLKSCEPEHLTALPSVMSHYEVSPANYQGGVASAVLVVNALGQSTRPLLSQYEQDSGQKRIAFNYTTHDALAEQLEASNPSIRRDGTTLDELTGLLKDCGLETNEFHVDGRRDAEVFRERALASLGDPSSQLLVNFKGADGHGYHSPVAAYHQGSDRFLIYNVSPPKPQPVWIETRALVAAMATDDSVSGHKRGYLVARAADGPARAPTVSGSACTRLDSPEGTALLQSCEPDHLHSLPGLMAEHQVQDNLFTCAPTSLSSVLNDLDLPRPGVRLSQDQLDALLPDDLQKQLATPGMGLSVANLELLAHKAGAKTERVEAQPSAEDPTGLDRFRKSCIDALTSDDRHIIVSFDRKALGQDGGGHFSPVAAYNAQEDKFLIYDTAPFKVSPVWVPAADLFSAMATYDGDLKAQRGYLVVGNPALKTTV